MKKIISIVTTVIMMVALCLTMTACSASIEGTYKLESMTVEMGGVKVEIETGKEFQGITITEEAVVLTINEDKTWSMKVNLAGQKEDGDGTWEKRGGKYYLISEENGVKEEVEATINGKKLTLKATEEGASMQIVLSKSTTDTATDSTSDPFVGTYKLVSYKMEAGGVKIEMEPGKEYNGVTLTEDSIVLTINKDKTFIMKTDMMGQSAEENGTWEQRDGKYYLTATNNGVEETIVVTLDGNNLTLEETEEGASMQIVLKK